MLPRAGPLTEALRSIRVVYTGTQAPRWFGSTVTTPAVADDWTPSSDGGSWIDILVVEEPQTAADRARIEQLTTEVRSVGAQSIAFVTEPGHEGWSSLADLSVGIAGVDGLHADVLLAPYIDLTRISPIGSLAAEPSNKVIAFSDGANPVRKRTQRRIKRLLGTSADDLTLETLESTGIAARLPELRNLAGVVDHHDLHASDLARSSYLAELSVAGVPFALLDTPSKELRSALGDGLVDLSCGAADALVDPEARRRLSVTQRRLGLDRFTDWNRWREIAALLDITLPDPPKVTMLLATKRPNQLEHAVEQLAKQTYAPVEPVIILHGDGFDRALIERLTQQHPNTRVLELPDTDSYGEILNQGLAASTGILIAKMDDDDWYSGEHINDLVAALEYSCADLVGKAAEWVYLAEQDVTVRRNNKGAEQGGKPLIAGGALMLRRDDLMSIGGFQRAIRYEDLGLKLDIEAAGGTRYRTHGFGFVLHRNASGHTWEAGLDHFMKNTSVQLNGFASAEAMVETGSDQNVSGRQSP